MVALEHAAARVLSASDVIVGVVEIIRPPGRHLAQTGARREAFLLLLGGALAVAGSQSEATLRTELW
jgi:hypothetical protein